MSYKSQKNYPFENRPAFVISLLLCFVVIFGVACIIAYQSYTRAIDAAIHSNETRATLLAKLILEHQRAAIGVLQSYADRPLLVDSVKKRDFDGTLKHLIDLAKHNPEMDWPFISNPDSTVWVNYPVDRQVMNKDLSFRDWYKGVKKEWKPYISSVYKLIVGEKNLAVAVSAPILDEKGKVIGILSTAQSTAFFRKIIGDVGLNLDAKITLIDQEGHIIYSNGFPYTREVIAYPPLEFIGKALKGEKGDVEVRDASDQGGIKYVSFVPIEGIGWSIIVEKASSEVLRSEFSSLVLIGFVSLLIYGVVVLFLIHLRERHRQIKGLEKLNEELDGRVHDRTAELEAGNRALRESEERFRTLANATFEGIGISEHGRIVDANEQLVEMIGGTRSELIGQEVALLVAPEDRDRVMASILSGMENHTEHRMFRRDGTPIIVETHGRTIAHQGRQVRITAIRDITERKRADEALRVSEEKYRSLFESMTQGVVYQDAEGKVISANPAAEMALGVPLEQMKGRTSGDPRWRSIHEDGSDFPGDTHPTMTALMTGDKVKDVVVGVFNPKLSEYRWLKVDAVPQFRPGENKPYQVYSLFDDITERRRAVEELKGSEEKFSALYSSMVEGVALHEVVYDSSGKPVDYIIADVNPAYESITGLSRDKAIGKKASEVYGINEPPYLDIYEKVATSKKPASFETYFAPMRKHFSISVFSPAKGRFATVFIDITECKQQEARLTADLAALARMHTLSGRLLGTAGLQPLLQEIMDAAVAIVGAERGTLQLLEGDSLRIAAHHGHQQPFLNFFASAESRASVCGEATRRGERVVVQDVETSSLFGGTASLPVLRKAGVRAVQSTPMISRTGTLIGILTTQWGVPFSPDEHDLWRIDLLSRQAADLIEYAKAEEALREAHERAAWLAQFPEQNPNPIIRVTADGTVLYCNPATAKQHGWKCEVGQVLQNELLPLVSQAMAEGRGVQRDMALGGRFYMVSAVPFSEEGYTNLYGRDITDRKQAEAALQQRTLELQYLNETLEQRVKERTEELANLSSQLVSAQENERQRVSYDLHDNVWQMLVAIRFEIERLFSRRDKADWAALQKKSKEVMANILEAVGKIRSMQGDLWPYVLDDIGVLATIDWYCRDFEKNHSGLIIESRTNLEEDEVPSSAKIVIYRVMQEAMSNVLKHSQANHVSLSLDNNAHNVQFTVVDNGIGFDPEGTFVKRNPWGGLGLLGIKARVELSGGKFEVESSQGKGTTVRATWTL
ncbi:MAG TPA: PAS domain S-box protein [Thermodesulfobacteriota bacterium]|nr:PAS domain S-box protein [Thermodesulfobacteriota bacterium]